MPAPLPNAIGRFQVVRALGHGGMGSVYLARDPRIGRDVAVKVLREGLDDPELHKRFQLEAQMAGQLSHINIVTIFEYGDYEGQPFIAMDYLQGHSLADLLRHEDSLPLARKLQIMDGVCAGLDYAHDRGLVHRDVSPANVFVADTGVVKILDFGIARVGNSKLTVDGQVMGKFSYMAPEQLTGGANSVDRRADIFSVGAVFYEILAWRRAFVGDLLKVVTGQPDPLEQRCPDLDPALIAVVNRCLEKRPEARYPDLGSVRMEVAAVRRRMVRRDITFGQQALEAGDEMAALDCFERVLMFDPDNGSAYEGREQARAAARDRQARPWLAQARRNLNADAYGQAFDAVDRALALSPGLAEAVALREQIAAAESRAREKAERARAIDEALMRGRQLAARGQFAPAFEAVGQALGLDPDNAAAHTLQSEIEAAEEAAVRQAQQRAAQGTIQAARDRLADGRHQEAIALLEAFQPAGLVAQALAELRAQVAAILQEAERQRQLRVAEVARRLADSTAALARQEFGAARRLADAVLRLDRDNQEAAGLLAAIDRAERRRDALEALADARELLRDEQFDAALAAADRAAQLDDEVPGLAGLRSEIATRKEAVAAAIREQAEKAQREREQKAKREQEEKEREREQQARREQAERAQREREQQAKREEAEQARQREEQARREQAETAQREQEENAARLAQEQADAIARLPATQILEASEPTVRVDVKTARPATRPPRLEVIRPIPPLEIPADRETPRVPPADRQPVPRNRSRTIIVAVAAIAAVLLAIVILGRWRGAAPAESTAAVGTPPTTAGGAAAPAATTTIPVPPAVTTTPPPPNGTPLAGTAGTPPEVVAARGRALGLIRSDPDAALSAAVTGLRVDPTDPVLNKVVDTLVGDASQAALNARLDAVRAKAAASAAARPLFDRAEQQRSGADTDRKTNRRDSAVRGYWTAAENYRDAAAQALASARANPAPPPPGQTPVQPIPGPTTTIPATTTPTVIAPANPPATLPDPPVPALATTTSVPKPDPLPPPPKPDPSGLIRQAINAYASGYSSESVEQLGAVWDIPRGQVAALREALRNADYLVEILSIGNISLDPSGRRATVTCSVQRTVRPTRGGGSRPRTDARPTDFTLEERQGKWIIIDVKAR